MKRQLSIFLFLLSLVFSVSAQEKESRKFGEFNSVLQCEYERSVFDNFFIELQNNPQSMGFIIFYEGNYSDRIYDDKGNVKTVKTDLPRYGDVNARIKIIRDHIRLRRYDPNSVLFIDGGFREEFGIEFWLVPNGADLPKPTPPLDRIKYRKGKPEWSCDY